MVASGHRSKSNVPLQHAVNFAAALGERYCPSMYGADTQEGVTAAPSTSVSVIEEKSTTDKFHTIVQISTVPVAVCYGVGDTEQEWVNQSSLADLNSDLNHFDQGCQMAKFDPFLSLACARVEGVGARSHSPEA